MRLVALVCLMALLELVGCRALPPPAPPPVAVSSAEEILARLKANQGAVQSFQAKGRLTLLSPQRNYSGTGVLKGQLPTTLRVDILDILGRSLLSFYSDGREVQVLSPQEGRLYRGPATPANLAALIPPGITLDQVVRLLVGDLPLSRTPPDDWRYDLEQDQYLLEWRHPDGSRRERLWVEARNFQAVKEEWFDDAGQPRFTIEFNEYGQLAPGRPRQVILRAFQPQAEMRLYYKEMQLNPPLSAAGLAVQRPEAVVEVPLKP